MSKLAVVTGGSRGIGYAIAQALAADNYDILLIARTTDSLNEAVLSLSQKGTGTITPLAVDLTDNEAVCMSFSSCAMLLRPVDVLVNAAGIFMYGTTTLSSMEMTELLKANIMSTHHVCAWLRNNLIRAERSHVFNLSSIAGLQGFPFTGGYSATKHAIAGYSKSLADELRHKKVFVTTLYPDVVDTDMSATANLDKALMIPTSDLAKTVQFILSLSERTYIDGLSLKCANVSTDALSR